MMDLSEESNHGDATRRQFLSLTTAIMVAGLAGCACVSSHADAGRLAMSAGDENKARLREFVRVVWEGRNLSQLPTYWTPNCVNHAAPASAQIGLDALRAYHEGFFTGFLPAFTNPKIDYIQQLAEGDRVVSQMAFSGLHTGVLFGKAPTHRTLHLASIRIDRFESGKIAEHWSVGDLAGLLNQIDGHA